MCLRDEIALAIAEVEVAVNILNNCAEDLTDSAIFRLSSAEARLNALLAIAKGEEKAWQLQRICARF